MAEPNPVAQPEVACAKLIWGRILAAASAAGLSVKPLKNNDFNPIAGARLRTPCALL
jgi:hypothetical protein